MNNLWVVLALALVALAATALYFSQVRRKWLCSRSDKALRRCSASLLGKPVRAATAEFGEPSAVFEGSGRTLHEWKTPAGRRSASPATDLTIFVVSDSAGLITHVSWETRRDGEVRSGAASAGAR